MEQQQGQHIAQHIMERLLLLHVSGLFRPGTRIISPFTQNVNMFIGIQVKSFRIRRKSGLRSRKIYGIFPLTVPVRCTGSAAAFAAGQREIVAEGRAAQPAHDVHEVGHVVVHEDDVVHLLAEVQRRHQQHGDRDAAGEARQR